MSTAETSEESLDGGYADQLLAVSSVRGATIQGGRLVTAIGGRRLVVAFEMVLVLLGIGWGPRDVARGTPPSAALLLSVFIGGPGLILVYDGYRLPGNDFPRSSIPSS